MDVVDGEVAARPGVCGKLDGEVLGVAAEAAVEVVLLGPPSPRAAVMPQFNH